MRLPTAGVRPLPSEEDSIHTMQARKLAALGTTLVVLTLGAAPLLSNAADHLDAPALGGTVVDGQFAPHSEHGDRDINDLYVFKAPDVPNRTVIALTVNPAINLFGGNFGKNVRYTLNIDTNGDNVQDIAYVARFNAPDGQGNQPYHIRKYTGAAAVSLHGPGRHVADGKTNGKAKNDGPERRRGLGRRPLGPLLLRPDRVHRHDHVADDRHGRRR